MREIMVEKATVNICIGEPGERLEKAKALLESLTGKKAIKTKTHRRSTFGVPKGREIGTIVTLRGSDAEEFILRTLKAKDMKLKASSFDKEGNFSYGIHEHIEIPGTSYDPEIGIMGLEVAVTLCRPGFRIRRRRIPSRIGKKHRITKEEAIQFVKEKFGVEVVCRRSANHRDAGNVEELEV